MNSVDRETVVLVAKGVRIRAQWTRSGRIVVPAEKVDLLRGEMMLVGARGLIGAALLSVSGQLPDQSFLCDIARLNRSESASRLGLV